VATCRSVGVGGFDCCKAHVVAEKTLWTDADPTAPADSAPLPLTCRERRFARWQRR
jgi:hypothetical protein